jgi:UDP-N-acetylmuramate: L-alanyl-gamma-D-glutamyl-meso-diaminopimelate ligase
MRIHFIAVGGSAMHNLAIALHKKGFKVSGSDDEIFEPSKSRLSKFNLLPQKEGWQPEMITNEIDAIILGMHAREDNPELLKAKEIGLKIYSFPEFLYQETKDKIRVVIGGSHGKTTITSMIMHVLKYWNVNFDYMVGAQIKGFETMVRLSKEAKYAIFEGDEYLSSPIDRRPKFHLYQPNIALISGIAWDHINVFPTFENYVDQFVQFINIIPENGTLIYNKEDDMVEKISLESKLKNKIPYETHQYVHDNDELFLSNDEKKFPVQVIGKHNLQNISAAKAICLQIDISEEQFYEAIQSFEGASKRLQLIGENDHSKLYFDFAHSPSKLKATVDAVKFQFPKKQIFAIMELHTFSSLNKTFLNEYKGCMDSADDAWVYYNPKTIEHKRLDQISKDEVKRAFSNEKIQVFDDIEIMKNELFEKQPNNTIILIMTSGNLSGIDINKLSTKLLV